MSLSFLGKKSFHPSNPQNLRKLFMAEEQKANEEKKREELQREHEADQTKRNSRRMLDKNAPMEAPPSTSFMYSLPPGLKEAQERQKAANAAVQAKAKEAAAASSSSGGPGAVSSSSSGPPAKPGDAPQQTQKERDTERFAILKNAPRQGAYTNEIAVSHRPFGVELRNVKCRKCGEWGHQAGDRECRLRHELTERDDEKKATDDPLARIAGAEASGGMLRWAPKAATAEGVHGGLGRDETNQQFVTMVDEEDAAALAAAAGLGEGAATMADLDPAVLAMLSEKQQRKLLKMYQREQRGDADGGGDGDGGRKRKKDKKEKHKSKKHKKHKSSSRRERDESSSESRS